MTQSRLAKGVTRPTQVQHEADDDERPEAGSREEASRTRRNQRGRGRPTRRGGIQDEREEHLQGGEVSDGEHLCRGLIALAAVLVGICAGAARASAACCSTRGRLATFRTVLQSLSSARTDTIHPAACSCCARRAMRIECPPASANPSSSPSGVSNTAPADRQHFFAVGVHAAYRQSSELDITLPMMPRTDWQRPGGVRHCPIRRLLQQM